MTYLTRTGKPLPQSIVDSAAKVGQDPVNRREFLAMASAFGATTATAYAMLGAAAPAQAASHAKAGGTVRIQQEVRALKDPRTYDWSQIANFSRGWLEYLVAYENGRLYRPIYKRPVATQIHLKHLHRIVLMRFHLPTLRP